MMPLHLHCQAGAWRDAYDETARANVPGDFTGEQQFFGSMYLMQIDGKWSGYDVVTVIISRFWLLPWSAEGLAALGLQI
jgi:hypothetical protein